MPKIIAPPVSTARSTAYESGTTFPGPRDDPDGWHESPSASFLGKFFDRETHISCNVRSNYFQLTVGDSYSFI